MCYLWFRRSRLGTDDPIGIGQFQTKLERPRKATIDEVPGSEWRSCECNSLAIDGGIDQHACAIERRTTGHFEIGNAGSIKPLRPGLPIVEMQQWKFQQVRRFYNAVTPGGELGAADWKKLLGTEADGVESIPIAGPVPDRNVDIVTGKVDMMHGCRDPQIDGRMCLGKATQPINQPLCSEIR